LALRLFIGGLKAFVLFLQIKILFLQIKSNQKKKDVYFI